MTELLECLGVEFYGLGKELTESGVSLRIQLHGQSMYPFIRDGDVVEIEPISMEQVRLGDVVFFRTGSRLLAHRVIRRIDRGRASQLVTQGDYLSSMDRPIENEASLIGRVVAIHRYRQVIRLDQGLVGLLGRWMARNAYVHGCVRWATRWPRRLGRVCDQFQSGGNGKNSEV